MIPAYGAGALSDVTPAAAAALGLPGPDPFGLPGTAHVVLLLVDGLGWQLLRGHEAEAPFLAGLAGRAITAGFPTTTATSLASVGLGLPPGGHGFVGLAFEVGPGVVMNALGWREPGDGDLRSSYRPEDVQPVPTVFERMAAAGVAVRTALPRAYVDSGLTRAVFRGGTPRGVLAHGDLVAAVPAPGDRTFTYAYHGDLDLLGHVYGPGSEEWRLQLAHVDRLAAAIADRLPPGGLLLVTADHGMITAGERVDVEHGPLADGVRLLAGEPRVRHVYAEPGADVLATWRSELGDRADVRSRDEAIAAGWFGPVDDRVRPRIGDVVAVATGTTVLVRPGAEPTLTRLTGQHGALTDAELLIPLLVHRG